MEKIPDIQKKGYNVFKGETTVFFPITYNFKNKTGNFAAIISQPYIRQALAHLQDQAGVVKGVFKGFAVETYGPLPSTPTSKYHPDNTLKNPYPFDIDKAAGILKDHGWEIRPGGVSTCTSPGAGPNQCGAADPPRCRAEVEVLLQQRAADQHAASTGARFQRQAGRHRPRTGRQRRRVHDPEPLERQQSAERERVGHEAARR